MGGSSSVTSTFHTYTTEELAERERVVKLQATAFDFVTKVIYYGVPIRSGKKSAEASSAIWIEPQPDLLDEMLANKDSTNRVSYFIYSIVDCRLFYVG